MELEVLLDKGFGQIRGVALDFVKAQVILPGLKRLTRGERGQSGESARLPYHELFLPRETRSAEKRFPVEARCAHREVPAGPVIVALQYLLGLRAVPVHLRHAPLEVEDAGGLALRVRQMRQRQHGGDMRLVLGADVGHVLRRIEVVVAVRHPQAALQQERQVAGGIIQVLRHPQTQQVPGIQVGGVEHVHVRAQRGAERAREPGAVLDGIDASQGRLQRLEAPLLDRLLIHEARVVVADLARLGAGGRTGGVADQFRGTFRGKLGELLPRTVAAAIGRNLGRLEPGTVGVAEKVIPGRDRAVDAGKIHAVGALGRRCRRRCGAERAGGELQAGNRHCRGERAPGDGARRADHGAGFQLVAVHAPRRASLHDGRGVESRRALREY